ncbi:MAG TPA: hypothetical protein VEB41_05700 [Burkholderiales bacterium]|nr:hypothetical protein [Burkholderiales bacterium]
MSHRKTHGRQLFLGYVCAVWVVVLMAAPLTFALEPAASGATAQRDAFRAADSDADGYVTPAEAARIPGLSWAYARADANGDEKLDRAEYRRAILLREGRL